MTNSAHKPDADDVRAVSIVVRKHPFDSAEARHLVPLLDADLAAMYPDWDELVHPGMHHENNPKPPEEVVREDSDAFQDEAKSSNLVFFVAFVSTPSTFHADAQEPATAQPEMAIGCGALRKFSQPLPPGLDSTFSYAEVKRMYVKDDWRGRGISKMILSEIERYTKEDLDIGRLVMETGLRQKAAIGLYRSAGYLDRTMFGEYIGADPASGGESICLEKALAQTLRPRKSDGVEVPFNNRLQ